jgi:hypothetical protein
MMASGASSEALSEKHQVQMALHLITIKYDQYIKNSDNLKLLMGARYFHSVVKFQDSTLFMKSFQYTGKARSGCTVNGFTDRLVAPPTIYINRATATPATLVHELLHFLTHSNFREAFKDHPKAEEGVTEYFTRKVLGLADAAKDMQGAFAVDRSGIYDEEHGDILMVRKLLREPAVVTSGRGARAAQDSSSKAPKGFLKKAYFLGDPDCIAILKSAF